jgi:hypothetical protein
MEKEIYKINNNTYIFTLQNFMKVNYNCNICNLSINKSANDIFPYRLLNIDLCEEMLYKDNNCWYLLKYQGFDSNLAVCCQQTLYKEYKIELINNIIVCTLNEEEKFREIYYTNFYDSENNNEIIDYKNIHYKYNLDEYEKETDEILKLLFCPNKWTFYNYNENNKFIIEMINVNIVKNNKIIGHLNINLIVKYNEIEYYYSEVNMSFCCGGGKNTFLLQDNKENMFKFNEIYKNYDILYPYNNILTNNNEMNELDKKKLIMIDKIDINIINLMLEGKRKFNVNDNII